MPIITIHGKDDVRPQLAQVLRDNQTIIWKLEPGLAWNPTEEGKAVKFLPETDFYSAWPGTKPRPVGLPPIGPDQRDYKADVGKEMADRQFEVYHYEIAVIDLTTKKRLTIRVKHGRKWYDPEVVNEPRP